MLWLTGGGGGIFVRMRLTRSYAFIDPIQTMCEELLIWIWVCWLMNGWLCRYSQSFTTVFANSQPPLLQVAHINSQQSRQPTSVSLYWLIMSPIVLSIIFSFAIPLPTLKLAAVPSLWLLPLYVKNDIQRIAFPQSRSVVLVLFRSAEIILAYYKLCYVILPRSGFLCGSWILFSFNAAYG